MVLGNQHDRTVARRPAEREVIADVAPAAAQSVSKAGNEFLVIDGRKLVPTCDASTEVLPRWITRLRGS